MYGTFSNSLGYPKTLYNKKQKRISFLFILPLDYYGLRLDAGVVGAENAHAFGVCLKLLEPADGFKLTLAGKAVAGNNEVVNVALREGDIGGEDRKFVAVNSVGGVYKAA